MRKIIFVTIVLLAAASSSLAMSTSDCFDCHSDDTLTKIVAPLPKFLFRPIVLKDLFLQRFIHHLGHIVLCIAGDRHFALLVVESDKRLFIQVIVAH